MLPAHGNASTGLSAGFTDPHNHYTFSGKEWDAHLDSYEFGYRQYDPAVGVWLTPDPLLRGEPSRPRTLHRYQYVFVSPISYRDAYGLWPAWLDQTANTAGNWISENKEVIASTATSIAVGAAVTVGVGLLTVSTGGVGTVILAGALGGAAAMSSGTIVGNLVGGRDWSEDVVKNTVIGGLTGGVTAGLSYALAPVGQAIAGSLNLSNAGSSVVREAINLTSSGFVGGTGHAVWQAAENLTSPCPDWNLLDDFTRGFGQGAVTYGAFRMGQAGMRYGLRNTQWGQTLVAKQRRTATDQAWQNQAELLGYDPSVSRSSVDLQGHHQYSVSAYPELADDSTFIEFMSRPQHLNAHEGDFRTPTHGPEWWK